ncbi:MAG: outer membrane beta-barrel protein [Bacteroidetes bacterium]|nr:outer membrane beta-barrel protein [Bacteroidota bacterium]MBL6942761.1 outer membrane beta-barrel protein [Bacteroidales bacterium]
MKNLKTIFSALLVFLLIGNSFSQVISEDAKRKITVGADFFTDFWLGTPEDMKLRAINQGFNAFAMYNFELGKGNTLFAAGLGIDNHNMYSDSRIENINGDTIKFAPIADDYTRSKINLTYLTAPLELKIRLKSGIKFGAGVKIRYLISSKDKYVGHLPGEDSRINITRKTIANTEDWAYGFTFRFGYKSINLFGYYQISDIFQKGLGPEMYPISVGLTLTPF